MRIQKCYFCSGPVYPGHGMLFVRNDCKQFRFCRPKCHKHFKAKHNPRKLAWTKAARKANNKQIAKDSILEFERKVNEPQIYNRNVYINTIQAMKKIADIRKNREDRFWENRMKLARVQKLEDVNKELEKHVDLISDRDLRQQIRENQKERLKVKEETKQQRRGQLTIDME